MLLSSLFSWDLETPLGPKASVGLPPAVGGQWVGEGGNGGQLGMSRLQDLALPMVF